MNTYYVSYIIFDAGEIVMNKTDDQKEKNQIRSFLLAIRTVKKIRQNNVIMKDGVAMDRVVREARRTRGHQSDGGKNK